jgi:hypothetical protein
MIGEPTINGHPLDLPVEDELGQLAHAPIAPLRVRYRELFRREPPTAFGPDLLRRSIAHQIQEKTYGSLPRESRKLLDRMIKAMAKGGTGHIEVPRRIKPGSELVRTWKGQTHKVTVQAKGFIYDGEMFSSLSEVANRITGTRWNGPKFFGLRTTSKESKPTPPLEEVSRGQ